MMIQLQNFSLTSLYGHAQIIEHPKLGCVLHDTRVYPMSFYESHFRGLLIINDF